jgi:integrase
MAKRASVTVAQLKSRTVRSKLPARYKPYFVTIAKGLQLGYRRNADHGVWTVRVMRGGDWTDTIAVADDNAASNHETILDFYEASNRAEQIAGAGKGGEPGAIKAPATVEAAIKAYRADLEGRGKSPRNADTAENHLEGDPLLKRPVALLQRAELRAFRDKLIAGGLVPASVNRITCTIKAALNLAAKNDRKRIVNQWEWTDGLEPLEGAREHRNVVISDDDVRRAVAAAYEDSHEFGVLIELAAVTGARYSQLARIEVRDLQADRARVMVPSSNKGRGKKNRAPKPLPIPRTLAAKLQQAAAGREPGAPLLVKPRGAAWLEGDQGERFERLAAKLGLVDDDGKLVTMYALRHTSITRQLLANVPIRVVADLHDTSVDQIEKTYSAKIGGHADALFRAGQIEIEPALKVVA